MLDIGWSELVLIGVVALIFVGPKDLPRMFHALGRFTAKARGSIFRVSLNRRDMVLVSLSAVGCQSEVVDWQKIVEPDGQLATPAVW